MGASGAGNFIQTGGSHNTVHLYLGKEAGGSGSYDLSENGTLITGEQFIGYYGSGAFNQSGGTNTVLGWDTLFLGYNAGASGTYTQSGGSLLADGIILGRSGSGSFEQSGGTTTLSSSSGAAYLFLGYNSTGSGTFTQSGGSLSVTGDTVVGDAGTGAFTQSGANSLHTTTNLILGNQATGSGTYTLNGGSLTLENLTLGNSGSGTFTQNGGIVTITNALTLANNPGSSGTYNLEGGSIWADTFVLNVGGVFNDDGGTFSYNHLINNGGIFNFGAFYLGRDPGSSESFDLASGTLNNHSEFIGYNGTGVFTQEGGTNAVGVNLSLAANPGSSGSYAMTGGSLSVGGNAVVGNAGSGTFTQDNSAADSYHTVGGSLTLGAQAGGSGSYSLTDTGSGHNISLAVTGDTVVGDAGTGSFTQTGDNSLHTTTNLILGNQSTGSGAYNLNGGSLAVGYQALCGQCGQRRLHPDRRHQCGDLRSRPRRFERRGGSYYLGGGTGSPVLTAQMEYVGNVGSGTFTQTGGTNTVNYWIVLGYTAGASGNYTLSGGSWPPAANSWAIPAAAPSPRPAAPIRSTAVTA